MKHSELHWKKCKFIVTNVKTRLSLSAVCKVKVILGEAKTTLKLSQTKIECLMKNIEAFVSFDLSFHTD